MKVARSRWFSNVLSKVAEGRSSNDASQCAPSGLHSASQCAPSGLNNASQCAPSGLNKASQCAPSGPNAATAVASSRKPPTVDQRSNIGSLYSKPRIVKRSLTQTPIHVRSARPDAAPYVPRAAQFKRGEIPRSINPPLGNTSRR